MIAAHFRAFRPGPALHSALLALLLFLPQGALAAMTEPPIDGDLAKPAIAIPPAEAAPASAEAKPGITLTPDPAPEAAESPRPAEDAPPSGLAARSPDDAGPGAAAATTASAAVAKAPAASDGSTWQKDDLIGAAQGVFGKGASGLAEMIEDLLSKQGEPNAYIVGREGGGALVFGLRYGSGTLYHKIEGQRPVYWTGPSLGLDFGANAASTFVLVYNLYDTEELYSRFGAGEGQAYLIGGFHVSYLRQGDKVLIPVRSGAGLRLGLNAGYMKFSHKQNWLPF